MTRFADRIRRWHGKWAALLPILMVEFVVVLGFGALLPVLPLYVVEHGVDIPTLGLITAAWGIAKLFSEPIFGYIADRTSRKPIMVAGLVLFGVFTALPLIFTAPLALFLLRLLAGASAGMYDPAARGIIVDATEEGERGEAFGLFAAFQMGGLLFGPVLGAFGAALGGGYGFPFALTGGLALVSAVYLAVALPSGGVRRVGFAAGPVSDRPGVVTGAEVAAAGEPGLVQAPMGHLFNRLLLAALVMNLGFALAIGVYEVVWSLYLEMLGASIEWIGFTFTLFALPVLFLSAYAGRLIDRHGGLRFAVVGGLAIAGCGILYALSTEPVFPALVILIEATATAFVAPALYSLLASGTPVGRSSTAQGIFGASTQVGIIVASLLAGQLYAIDPRWPFLAFVGGTTLAILLGLLIAWGAQPLSRTTAAAGACLVLVAMLTGCTATPQATQLPAPSPSAAGTAGASEASPSIDPSASAQATPPGPPGSTEPVIPDPSPTATATTYVVRPGDSLTSIADRFDVSVGQLLVANPEIQNADDIRSGDSIIIPTPDAPTSLPRADGISDARGDLLDLDDQPTFATGAVDLTGLGARLDADTIFLELRVGAPPPALSPDVEQIIYTVNIDTTDDGEPDFRLIASNALDATADYAASFTDLAIEVTSPVGSFPGTFEVAGAALRFGVLRSALGEPRQYAIAVTAERRFFPGGVGDPEVEAAVDRAPDQQWPRANARWLEIGR